MRVARIDPVLVAAIAGPALLHLAVLTEYGWFRDELYYVACAMRPALGYVDHPPLAPWVAALVGAVAGESLFALRLVAVLCGAGTAWLAASTARRLGGGRGAAIVAALALAWSPVHLYVFHVFSMNSLEPLLWTAAVRVGLELFDPTRQPAPRARAALGIALGAALGLATLAKHAGGCSASRRRSASSRAPRGRG